MKSSSSGHQRRGGISMPWRSLFFSWRSEYRGNGRDSGQAMT